MSYIAWSCPSITHQPPHLPPEQQYGWPHQPCHAKPGPSFVINVLWEKKNTPSHSLTGDSNGAAATGCSQFDCPWSRPQTCQVNHLHHWDFNVFKAALTFPPSRLPHPHPALAPLSPSRCTLNHVSYCPEHKSPRSQPQGFVPPMPQQQQQQPGNVNLAR